MNTIIVGGGKTGIALAAQLVKQRHAVNVVEKQLSRIAFIKTALSDHREVQIFAVDGTTTAGLEEAGIREADLIITATHSDEINSLIAQKAAIIFKVPKILALVRSEEMKTTLTMMNLTAIDLLSPTLGAVLHASEQASYTPAGTLQNGATDTSSETPSTEPVKRHGESKPAVEDMTPEEVDSLSTLGEVEPFDVNDDNSFSKLEGNPGEHTID